MALDGRYRTRGLRVVATHPINDDPAGTEREAIGAVAREEHMTYPTFLDSRSGWARRTGLGQRPSFLLVGRDGRVVHRLVGMLEPGTPEHDAMITAIERALGAPTSASR